MGQVRRACEVVRRCEDRGDDPDCWAKTLAAAVARLAGAGRVAVVFPAEGVCVTPAGPAGPAGGAAAFAVAAAAGMTARLAGGTGRAAAGPALLDGSLTGWAWRDRRGRVAAVLAGPAGVNGPPVGEAEGKLVRLVVRGLSRSGPRLARPGDPTPGDLPEKTREVLRRLLLGQLEKEIAGDTGVSSGAVHKHVHRIYKHFGVNSRGALLARWLRRGWGRRCDWRPSGAAGRLPRPRPPLTAGAGGRRAGSPSNLE